MASERITITLPERLAKRVRQEARKTRRPVSRVIADAIKAQEDAEIRERMIQGYKECSEENVRLAEEGMPLFAEVLGIDPPR
jgi:predicted transcriptional regulator